MSDIDYGEVFGIDMGANEPAPAQQDTGNTETQTEDTKNTGAEPETDTGAKETAPAEQSAEENAKYAAARRKAEANAARYVNEAIQSLGLTDTYTGKPITTKAEYDAFKAKQADAKKAEVADAAGMTSEEFEAFVDETPRVKALNERVKQMERRESAMKLQEQITKINAIDPEIKSVDDLLNLPEYQQIYSMVQAFARMENPPEDQILLAYKAVNVDKLTKSAAERAAQAARNSAEGKAHLAPTASRGTGSVPVPQKVKEYYKMLNPDATDAEIQAHYNKTHNTT